MLLVHSAHSHRKSPDSGSGRPGREVACWLPSCVRQHILRIAAPQADRKLVARTVRGSLIRKKSECQDCHYAVSEPSRAIQCFWCAKETAAKWELE